MLHALAALLRAAQATFPLPLLCRVAELLAGVDATGLLLNNVFGNADAPPHCRAAAGAALCAVAELCSELRALDADAAVSRGPPRTPSEGVEEPTEAGRAVSGLSGGLSALLQAIVRTVGMPQPRGEALQLRGRHVLRLSLTSLRSICGALPCEQWSQCVPLSPQLRSNTSQVKCALVFCDHVSAIHLRRAAL